MDLKTQSEIDSIKRKLLQEGFKEFSYSDLMPFPIEDELVKNNLLFTRKSESVEILYFEKEIVATSKTSVYFYKIDDFFYEYVEKNKDFCDMLAVKTLEEHRMIAEIILRAQKK